MVTPFLVLRIILSFFCLAKGLSKRAKMHWWAMSGRTSVGSLLILPSCLMWSSLFKSSIPRLVYAVSKALNAYKNGKISNQSKQVLKW